MMGWFQPRCPVDLREKVWTELRLEWLAETFGWRRMLDAQVILPTPEFFPDPYQGQVDDARVLLDRVCGYMGADPGRLDLECYENDENPGTAGLYFRGEREVICVAHSQLEHAESLIATLAHEVAHSLLLGDGRLTGDEEDHEWLTDLLPLFLGMGVFAANTVMLEKSESNGRHSSWWMSRQGYLPARMHGYALALFASMRGEIPPSWAEHLRLDVRRALQDGLKYLAKSEDTLLDPRRPGAAANTSPAGLLSDLQGASDSARLAALWRLVDAESLSPSLFPAVARCAEHRNPIVRAAAARVLASVDDSPAVMERLKDLLADREAEVRAAAAAALGISARREPEVVHLLADVLDEEMGEDVLAAMWCLGRYGPDAADATPKILKVLNRGLVTTNSDWVEAALEALLAIARDPQDLHQHFAELDEVSQHVVLAALEDVQKQPTQLHGPSLGRPTHFGIRSPKGPGRVEGGNNVM